ncbi:hypothetical protein FPQ18DRAFT_306703 [Pyronema domesticum]|nr:hypothetical protein FPQ18DRAFT_306703 [Pyronema domesticum]
MLQSPFLSSNTNWYSSGSNRETLRLLTIDIPTGTNSLTNILSAWGIRRGNRESRKSISLLVGAGFFPGLVALTASTMVRESFILLKDHEKSKLSNVLHTLAPAITAVAPDFTAPASVSVSRDWHWSIGHWKASVATGSDP